MSREAPFSFGVVLLAAGASRRMGRPKLLLPWGATTVLGHLLEGWNALHASQIVVVIAAGDPVVPGELDRLTERGADCARVIRVVNLDPARGMFSSVQAAAQWVSCAGAPHATHWLVSLGDQPQVRWETWDQVLTVAAEQPDRICQPARHGRARHPVAFPVRLFETLASAPEPTLKEFLAARPAQRLSFESDDPGLDLDLDFPEDYQKARHLPENGVDEL